MEVEFRNFETFRDKERVRSFVKLLYEEDLEGQKMSDEKIDKTFSFLQRNPSSGTIIVFDHRQDLVGYALLINYWSNEYGGNILHLNEIYVDKACRNRGIARQFIDYLVESRYNHSVAIRL